MYVKAIEVSQFRQFRDTVLVSGLDRDLNVIAGANEEGKSTLFQAVRAALFERYNSSVGESYRPYGSAVSPKIRLVFELDGLEYELTKIFSRKRDGAATLKASDGRQWEGPAAEEYLSEQIGFSYAQRGGSRPELQGIAGLLWVEQAQAWQPVVLSDQSRSRVHSVFDSEMNELLGGDRGEALFKHIEEQRREYFDARGNPRAEYKAARESKEKREDAVRTARDELKVYEEKTDTLARRRATLDAYAKDRVVEGAEAALRQAREQVGRLKELETQLDDAIRRVREAESAVENATLRWGARTRLNEEDAKARNAVAAAEDAYRQAQASVGPAKVALDAAESALREKRAARSQMGLALQRAHDVSELARLTTANEELADAIEKATALEEALKACREDLQANLVTGDVLQELYEIDRDRVIAMSRLEAAATRLQYGVGESADVQLGGKRLSGQGTKVLSEPTNLVIDGVGQFVIQPGGDDLEAFRQKHRERTEFLEQRLAAVDASTLDEAIEMQSRRQTRQAEAVEHEAKLSVLAPDGLQSLEDHRRIVGKRQESLRQKLGTDVGDPGDLDELEGRLGVLTGQLERLEQDVAEKRDVLGETRQREAEARAAFDETARRLAAAQTELGEARAVFADDVLASAVTDTQADLKGRESVAAAVRLARDAENPFAVNAELERTARALKQVTEDVESCERDVRDLTIELNTLGQRGLAEALATAETEHEVASQQFASVQAQALAVDLLYRTLSDALKRAKQAISKPVVDRLLPYLKQLIPNAEPAVNEELVLTGISRGGNNEDFEGLSIGTREQLAILLRIAYADLLSEAGVPVMVILDDALVNTDDERRDRMKSILYQAAKRYQILLLTCHAREYRDAGGTFLDLGTQKAAGQP